MSSLSRRSMLQALAAQAIAAKVIWGQTPTPPPGPKALAKDAVTSDWLSFLGPSHNGISVETRLSRTLPPPRLWEFSRGTGYASPAVAGNRLVYLHRVGDEESVECLRPETGASQWRFRYSTNYRDRYDYNDGPRASPVIDGERVYIMGAETKLHCLDLTSGTLLWKRDLRTEYKVPQDFFGTASTPLVEGQFLIVNVGAPGGPTVAAFDKVTGKEAWRAGKDWGPSYASPVPATIHGKRRVLVFAGGESSPPTGGLLCIDPANGRVDFSFPWRSRTVESVNASCPVVFDNKVFISASYRTGGALLEILPDFTHRVLWTNPDFALHFNTAIYKDGHLYGFDGRNQGDASLACVNAATGKVVWRETPEWTETINDQQRIMGTDRGSLLHVDGAFLCLGEAGHLLWMDLTPQGYKEISRTWLFAAPESWSLPVLSRGLLYVTQNSPDLLHRISPRLLCYDLRA